MAYSVAESAVMATCTSHISTNHHHHDYHHHHHYQWRSMSRGETREHAVTVDLVICGRLMHMEHREWSDEA